VRLGVIGAGQFAQGVLLPAFARQKSVGFQSFCTASGFTSKAIAERYKAASCTSDPSEVIEDENIDAVVIATRHDQHAPLALQALRAGKAVFVEKPLALDAESLESLCEFARANGPPRLMVGFNRRFSPLAAQCRSFFEGTNEPLSALYRINAGALPRDSWVFDPVRGGGRIIGEGCHFIDTLCYLTDALPTRVYAESLVAEGERTLDRDTVSISLRMSNGSICTVQYLANGDPSLPKEYCEVFGGQKSAILDNYRTLTLHRGNRKRKRRLMNQEKGFKEEAAAFVDAVKSGGPMPIDFESLVAVTRATFLVHESLDNGSAVDLDLADR
jgi:polar amino acid transport system substrate-binding protein